MHVHFDRQVYHIHLMVELVDITIYACTKWIFLDINTTLLRDEFLKLKKVMKFFNYFTLNLNPCSVVNEKEKNEKN